MSTPQIIAVTLFLGIAAGVFIWLRLRTKKIKETADEVKEEAKTYRHPSADKSAFNGVILSEGKVPDIGPAKGSVIGDSTAIVAKHTGATVGMPVYAYDESGSRHDRAVVEVVTTDRLGAADILIIKVDKPFPPSVKRWELPDVTPARLAVMHIDGKWTDRVVTSATLDRDVLVCSNEAKHVRRLLIPGESGLPWRAGGKLASHSYRGWHGHGPNYARLKKEIEEVAAQLDIVTK